MNIYDVLLIIILFVGLQGVGVAYAIHNILEGEKE